MFSHVSSEWLSGSPEVFNNTSLHWFTPEKLSGIEAAFWEKTPPDPSPETDQDLITVDSLTKAHS
jgi:hypothetical protein